MGEKYFVKQICSQELDQHVFVTLELEWLEKKIQGAEAA